MQKLVSLFIFVMVLSGCASAPQLQQPVQFNKTQSYELYRSSLLEYTDHTLQHLNANKDILYFQTFGGSVGVGVMFGPLGVLANVQMIESNTMADVALLKDKIAVDPKAVFLAAASNSGVSIASAGSNKQLRLNPYVLMQKMEDDRIVIASVIIVDHVGSKNNQQSRYMIQLPSSFTIAELSTMDVAKTQQLERSINQGFEQLFAALQYEATTNVVNEPDATVSSDFLTPRFKTELAGKIVRQDSSYTWFRSFNGVFGLITSDTVVKKTAKK